MIRALIFDMDGTLVDSERLHYEAWKKTLADHGIHAFTFENFVDYIGTSNEKLASDYIITNKLSIEPITLAGQKQQRYLSLIPAIEPLPGVRDILSRFGGRYPLAIASSSHSVELHLILESLELTGYFDHVVGGEMVHRKKPDPAIYLHTCSLLDVRAEECAVFEDSQPGIAAAKAAGMIGIAIPNLMLRDADFSIADRILTRIDEANDDIFTELGRIGNSTTFSR